MRQSMGFAGRFVLALGLMSGAVILEVLLAMMIYIYVAVAHRELFGELVRMARDALTYVFDGIEKLPTEVSNQAYATLIGELGPKSFLLLVIGLVASGLIRMVVWVFRRIAVRSR